MMNRCKCIHDVYDSTDAYFVNADVEESGRSEESLMHGNRMHQAKQMKVYLLISTI